MPSKVTIQISDIQGRVIREIPGGDYLPGLFLTTGHGSRGLTSTPLAAQILASQVCGEALPLSRELYRAVAPGRFIIRKLSRGQA